MPEFDDDFEEESGDEDLGGGAGEEEGEEEGYLWVSTGESCPQCEAYDGQFFQVLPERPHQDCDCEVQLVRPGTRTKSIDCENEWEIDYVGNTRYGPGGLGLITHWQITVTCWDGAEYTSIEDVDHGDDPDLWELSVEDLEGEAWNELYERAEEIAADNCRTDCEPWPVG